MRANPLLTPAWYHSVMIRICTKHDMDPMLDVINDAATAYKGVIPCDRWREPYMSAETLRAEFEDGVEFWGYQGDGRLVGVMGIQDRGDAELIRHAYIRTARRNQGIGSELLHHLRGLSDKPLLVGTWAAADWAIHFYRKNGFRLLPRRQAAPLLRTYWTVPERQMETSVVLVHTVAVAVGA